LDDAVANYGMLLLVMPAHIFASNMKAIQVGPEPPADKWNLIISGSMLCLAMCVHSLFYIEFSNDLYVRIVGISLTVVIICGGAILFASKQKAKQDEIRYDASLAAAISEHRESFTSEFGNELSIGINDVKRHIVKSFKEELIFMDITQELIGFELLFLARLMYKGGKTFMKEITADLAEKFGVKPPNIERNLRTALHRLDDPEIRKRVEERHPALFHNGKPPTVKQFIAYFASIRYPDDDE